MSFIKAEKLIHAYSFAGSKHRSLDEASLSVNKGEFVTVLGCNGCGKTTLARHLNVLLPIQGGELTVAGVNAADENNVWVIRNRCGMVFQNPDNQFVSTLIEEDLAFAPRNFGVPEREIPKRIKKALSAVGMSGYEKHSPHMLSGGQKQRVAIARAIVNKPRLLLADEPTGALDTKSGEQIMELFEGLNSEGVTIVMITHEREIADYAKRIMLIRDGEISPDNGGETA